MVQLDTKFLEEVCDEREQASDFEKLGCCIFVQNKTLIGSIQTFLAKLNGINQVPKEKELVKQLLG